MLKCDVCGQFVSHEAILEGEAVRQLITPDSHFTTEEYETLCEEHADG